MMKSADIVAVHIDDDHIEVVTSRRGRAGKYVRVESIVDKPIPMRLPCPGTIEVEEGCARICGVLHVDVGEFATKPHHTHACQACGHVWRPAVVNTVGVRFLPGYKSEQG